MPERNPIGAEVVLIDRRGAPSKPGSPRNACKSDFVDPAALCKTN